MPWVVETVQEVVDDVPLALDTSNVDAIEAAIKVCKLPPLINSIMVRPERYERMVPIAAENNCDFIALMWGPDGLPRDENERAALCVELVYFANEAGIPNEKIWVDGIVTPVNIQQPQVISLMEFQGMLQDMAPGVKSTCGLSNISNGPPNHLRPILNQTYMVMLQKYGMYSVIADPLDDLLIDIAKGNRQDIVDLIYGIMDGEDTGYGQPLQGNAGFCQDHQCHPGQIPLLRFLARRLIFTILTEKKPLCNRGAFL